MALETRRLHPTALPSPATVRTGEREEPVALWSEGNERERRGRERSGKWDQVIALQEIWEIEDEWWREPISRLYYRIILENGRCLTLFRDLASGRWYTQ